MTTKTINVGDKIKLSTLGVGGGIFGVPLGTIGKVIFVDSDETVQVEFPDNEIWWYGLENALIDKVENKETEENEGVEMTDKKVDKVEIGDKVQGFSADYLYTPRSMDAYIGQIGEVVSYDPHDDTVFVKFPDGESWWYAVGEILEQQKVVTDVEVEVVKEPVARQERKLPIVWSVNDTAGRPDYVCTTRKEARTYASYGQRVVKYLAESDAQDVDTVKGDTIWAVVKKDGNQFINPNEVDGFWVRQDARDWIDSDKTLKVVKYVAVKS